MLVDHLCHRVSQQNHVLIKGLDVPLQFDAVDQVNRHGDVLLAKHVKKG
ncbi:MAG: hypothetical protein RJA72_1325, partial [Pseudomonadota bacterium]